jgi:hypothetical protein
LNYYIITISEIDIAIMLTRNGETKKLLPEVTAQRNGFLKLCATTGGNMRLDDISVVKLLLSLSELCHNVVV